MEYLWFENGEYWAQVEEMRSAIMRDAMKAETEAQTAQAFQNQLAYFIRLNTGIVLDFHPEAPIKGMTIRKFGSLEKPKSGHGRLDAVVNNLVIEYKKYSKLEKTADQQAATNQVKNYLISLYETEKVRCDAILTDGVKISYFSHNEAGVESTSFKNIEAKDIDRIIRAILSNNCKKFIPENILRDFAVDGYTSSVSKELANSLYNKLRKNPSEKTQMLFCEWESLMHLSFDDNGKGNDIKKRREELSLIFDDNINSPIKEYRALFALQTAYSIIVKLIACKVIDKLDYGTSIKNYSDLTKISAFNLREFLEKLEDGYAYRNSNILNLLEGDFFSWYATEEQWDTQLWKIIINVISCIDEYSAFSFEITYEPVDIFKDLYMSIMPKSVRHSMGEYFTPSWLADYVTAEGISLQDNPKWKAIDPCCGSGTFIISLIKHIVGNVNLHELSDEEKRAIKEEIISRVYGIDINPLSVLSARVGYYLALRPFGEIRDVEIPIYLGDSAITPSKEVIDSIDCYKYSVANQKKTFEVTLPCRFVEQKSFGLIMLSLQTAVQTNDSYVLHEMIKGYLTEKEKESVILMSAIKHMSNDLIELHENNWDGIWIRIATNFMLIARLSEFDLIVGNPPWVKWEHLPSKYAEKIKELCNVRHIFSTRGRFGGTQLNICALISNVAATNWLKNSGVLAFLMPDSIMSQNSYEEFRYFYTNFNTSERLYLQRIDKWEKPLKPFSSEEKIVSQDFNTYYFARTEKDYTKGIDVTTISRQKNVSDAIVNRSTTFTEAKKYLIFGKKRAAQMSSNSSAFSYLSDIHDFTKIIGESDYEFRTGVEFTPQELYLLIGEGVSDRNGHYRFVNKKFSRSKYLVDDIPKGGWDLPTEYIYPIATGPSLSPFRRNIQNEFCILPYAKEKTDAPVEIADLISKNNELFQYLIKHQKLIDSQSEKSKIMHRGQEFYALSKIGPYTFAEYIVAARDNTKFCASVIEPVSTPWGDKKQTICVKHTMLISRNKVGRFISKDEAYYICGILNSDIVVEYIQNTFKSNGYSLKKAHFYLPQYNSSNVIHKRICALAQEASEGDNKRAIAEIQSEISDLYLSMCNSK